ncbi:Uncharacterised protein [Serratia proteamaculans]|nr:Uncharacterised protein [Serratia proteamaculans]
MNFNRILTRLAAAVSIASITTGLTKWPDVMFISSCVMLLIWLHAEWDWRKRK